MVCIYCSSPTKVTNSRQQKRNNTVWRRRSCTVCKALFTTIENTDLEGSVLIRHTDGSLKPFLRDKLYISVYESCRHRKSAQTDATALTMTIISRARQHIINAQLSRDELVSTAYQTLQAFDRAAYTHYVAYHPTKK